MKIPGWFEAGADGASLLGLVITASVWWQVRSIKRSFMQRARLPELSRELVRISSVLLTSLGEAGAESNDHGAEIARLNAILVCLRPKVDRPQRDAIKRVLSKCSVRHQGLFFWKPVENGRLSRDQAWEIYNDTQGLIESLKQAYKDLKWG